MAKLLLLLTIFIVPLLSPVSGLGYEQAKVFAFLTFITLIGTIWLIDQSKHPKLYTFNLTKIKITGLLFLAIIGVASVLGVDPFNSLTGRPPYYQGLILYTYLFLFSAFISVYKISLMDVSKALAASSLAVSLVAIKDLILLEVFNKQVPLYSDRVVSTFGQPNFYAGFLLICLPFICSLAITGREKTKWLSAITLLLSILVIGLSGSRSVMILAFMAILFTIFGYINYKRRILLGLVSAVVIIIALYYSFALSSGFIYKEYLQPKLNDQWLSHNSPEKRLFIWPVIFELIREKPLLGYGLANLESAWSSYFRQFKPELGQMSALNYTLKNLYISSSHNYLLDLVIFSGVLGLLGWLGILGIITRSLLPPDAKRYILMASLLLYLLFIQFQNQSIVHLIQFWMLIGLIDIPTQKVNH